MSAPTLPKLTLKQEAFCRSYIENGGNASAAYRANYNAENMSDTVVRVKACELLKNGKVAVTIKAEKQRHSIRHDINIETLTQMLVEDRIMARENGQAAAAVNAVKALGQLHGFFVERKEVGRPGEFAELDELTDTDLSDIARASGSRAFAPENGAAWSTGVH